MNRLSKKTFVVLNFCLLLLVAGTEEVWATHFGLNWTKASSRINEESYLECNRGGGNNNCDRDEVSPGTDPDRTPFLQEALTDPNGRTYFHLIIGLPTDAFAQEVYIERQACFNNNENIPCSRSGGAQFSGSNGQSGGGWDPLRQNFGGAGTGDPTKMIVRQILKTPEMTQEFLKASFSQKARIAQNITTTDLSTEFVLDMSNSDYLASTTADNNTPGIMTNKVTLIGPNAGIFGNFDATSTSESFVTANALTPHITAGLFTFTAGAGWTSKTNFDPGSYSYAENGSASMTGVDWQAFRNPADNIFNFNGTPGTRLKGGNICKTGNATTPPVGC